MVTVLKEAQKVVLEVRDRGSVGNFKCACAIPDIVVGGMASTAGSIAATF